MAGSKDPTVSRVAKELEGVCKSGNLESLYSALGYVRKVKCSVGGVRNSGRPVLDSRLSSTD